MTWFGQMIGDLLTPEAQRQPHPWSATFCIGNGLRFEALACWAASLVIMAVGWRIREAR